MILGSICSSLEKRECEGDGSNARVLYYYRGRRHQYDLLTSDEEVCLTPLVLQQQFRPKMRGCNQRRHVYVLAEGVLNPE